MKHKYSDYTPEQLHSEFIKIYEYEEHTLFKKPRLNALAIKITSRCNEKCMHCLANTGRNCEVNELSLLDIKKVIINVLCGMLTSGYSKKYISTFYVALTGGETLLHKDFFEIVDYIHRLNMKTAIITNGTLIDKEMAQKIKEHNIDSIVISIDGLEDTHDWFRQTPGGFQKAINAFINLKEIGINPAITTTVHKKSINELSKLYEIIKDLNCDSWRLHPIITAGRANKNTDLLLDADDYHYLYSYIKDAESDEKINIHTGCTNYTGFEFEGHIRDRLYTCTASQGNMLYISDDGSITSCGSLELNEHTIMGNIYKDSAFDVWSNKFDTFRQHRDKLNETCRKCKHRVQCRGGDAHSWDFETNTQTHCPAQKMKLI